MVKLTKAIKLSLDKTFYPREAVLRTCYALADRLHIELEHTDKNENTLVNIYCLDAPSESEENIKVLFYRTLTDFSLRHQIETKTRKIRDTIVTAALLEMDVKLNDTN